jgi:phosphonate transport system substrate-binding protein
MRIVTYVLLLSSLLSISPLGTYGAAPAESTGHRSPYTLSVVPFYSPEKIWVLYTPFIEHLRTRTGLAWELKFYPNHEALLSSICSGEVGIALLGPVPLGRVIDRCGAEPLLVALGRDGKPFYRSVIVTGNSSLTSLADLRGKPFAFFKGSTAAHIVPATMLRNAGVRLQDLQTAFYESQDRIIKALLTREVMAAGVKESLYRKFKDQPLKVLAVSDPLPNFAFCAAPSLDRRTRERFIAALADLRPLANSRDASTVKDWDDEINAGFTLPTPEFRESVLKIFKLSEEIMHDDR